MKPLKIFKFGGASIQDAPSMARIRGIISNSLNSNQLIVVVSALGKTTNALEKVVLAWHQNQASDLKAALNQVVLTHREIISQLDVSDRAKGEIQKSFDVRLAQLEVLLANAPHPNYNLNYDQIVSFGELFSTTIFSEYLVFSGLQARFQDVREWIITEEPFREARILWEDLEKTVAPFIQNPAALGPLTITQGFIGRIKGTELTSTLGREGSDYTGAILAALFNAKSLCIWKDVAGVMNADPRLFPDAIKFDVLSYREAIEMTYYGATVIHPKTIKPLQNKAIPLYIKSFIDPEAKGTIIQENTAYDSLVPSYIVKDNQVLVSLSTRDFSFVVEDNLRDIFDILVQTGVRIHLMENSAISFSMCMDHDAYKQERLFAQFASRYSIRYNEGLSLVTVRHYDEQTIKKLISGREVLLEQRSRATVR